MYLRRFEFFTAFYGAGLVFCAYFSLDAENLVVPLSEQGGYECLVHLREPPFSVPAVRDGDNRVVCSPFAYVPLLSQLLLQWLLYASVTSLIYAVYAERSVARMLRG